MRYETITSDAQLAALCDRLAGASAIGLDTEFVSEDTYRSHLCLIQVVTAELLAVIDPVEIKDLKPFWTRLAEGDHETVVHAGREEFEFCHGATGRRPSRLFDIQVAAAMVGFDYPAAYSSLAFKIVGQRPPKGETRTDWRRRPLTRQQIEYALGDVRHLLPVRDKLREMLESLGRQKWIETEMLAWQQGIEDYRASPRWRRVSGISGLSRRGMAIVRELWQWREEEARRYNQPPKRLLRDDLIVEMAKRGSDDPNQILAVRGLEHRKLKQAVGQLAECVHRALQLPEDQCPQPQRRDTPGELKLLGQFLSTALASICRQAKIAPSLVGTANDVRELVAYRLGFAPAEAGELPGLATGWRAEVVGHVIDDLLAGKVSIRIQDPTAEEPLVFERTEPR